MKKNYIQANTPAEILLRPSIKMREKGYKASWVTIELKDENGGHVCNVFNTKDKGLVYIDCTGSTRINQVIGIQLLKYKSASNTNLPHYLDPDIPITQWEL